PSGSVWRRTAHGTAGLAPEREPPTTSALVGSSPLTLSALSIPAGLSSLTCTSGGRLSIPNADAANASVTPVPKRARVMAVFPNTESPFWGIAGDRYGRGRETVRAVCQCRAWIAPSSTRSPDDAGLPSARCRVTVSSGKLLGTTPAQRVTLRAS